MARYFHNELHKEDEIIDKTTVTPQEDIKFKKAEININGPISPKSNFFKDSYNKIANFFKGTASKIKQYVSNFGKEETKLLPSGQEREQASESIESTKAKFNDFVKSMKLESWVNDSTYTKEQAEHALKISNNPQKYMNNRTQSTDIQTKAPETMHEM